MSKNKEALWRCQNYGLCGKADESSPVPIDAGAPFRCPECDGEEGVRVKAPKAGLPLKKIIIGVCALLLLLLLVNLLTPPPKPPPPAPRSTQAKKPIEDLRTAIDRQVLSRPDSNLYDKPDGAPVAGRLLKNFERLFVFTDDGDWVEVGESIDRPLGWMRAEDTVDWPHSIVVEYGDPVNRSPVLFFRDPGKLQELADSQASREDEVGSLYQTIEDAADRGAPLPETFPVVCMEPGQLGDNLYINPVLGSRFIDMDGMQARLLQITAAGLERGATEFTSPEYLEVLKQNRKRAESALAEASREGVELDLVFVVDMTGSMQLWVDGLFAAIQELASSIESNPGLKDRVRLGLWGYQDNQGYSGIQFLKKNFTPELLEPSQFAALLDSIVVNQRTPDSYPEDVFAGLTAAVGETNWRAENRFLMLIGDAPGHTSRNSGGATDINASQVRQIADDAEVKIVSLAILDSSNPDFVKYHAPLKSQFETLATNGNDEPAFLTVDSGEESAFKEMIDHLLGELVRQRSVENPNLAPPSNPGEKIGRGLLESAVVRAVAQEVDEAGEIIIPRDITGWVIDRDLLNPKIVSLEPKLLVTRSELNSLLITTERMIREVEAANILGGDFYDAVLKAVAGSASGNRSERIKDRLPDFIKGLPYRSDFMEKSRDWWANATSEETDRFLAEMKAKLTYYREVNENPDLWKPLNRGAPSGNHVAAVPFSQLL